MLELDCVLNGLHGFEIGQTSNPMIVYFKSKQSLADMQTVLIGHLSHYGLHPIFENVKSDQSGTARRVRLIYDGSWD